MGLVENIKSFLGNKKNFKVEHYVKNASIYLEWNFKAEYFKIYQKIKDKWIEYCITYDCAARIDFCPVGISVFKICAYNTDEVLDESDEITVKINTLEINYAFDEEKVHMFWNKTGGTDGYKIYKKSGDALYTGYKETKKNEIYLYGLPQETEFKIKPFKNVEGEKVFKRAINKMSVVKGVLFTSTDKLFGLLAIPEKSNISLMWKPVKDADSYKIYKKSGENFDEIDCVKSNQVIIKHLPVGDVYLGVQAFKGDECIAHSYILRSDIQAMEVFSVNIDKKVYLYWNKVSNIDGYRIYKKNEKNEFVGFMNVTDEEVYLSNVKPGEKCEFKVKPFKMLNGQREFTKVNAKCKVDVYSTSEIKAVINEAYGNKIAVSWIFDGNVDGYEIFKGENKVLNIEDAFAHIALLDFSEDKFVIKGYKKAGNKILYTCKSQPVSILDKNNRLNMKPCKKYKVSVIIPSYNSEDYISRSISTVLGADLDELELIVVDDGSVDNTKGIIDWYCEKYPCYVKKIFKQNGGVADARNYGIAAAQGEFLAFMDNDDMIRPDGYSALYNAIKKTKSDIAIAPLYRIDSDQYTPRHVLKFKENTAHSIDDYLKLIYSDGYNNIGVWNKLYKTSLVQKHPFGLLAYEDVSWTPYILSWADKFCYIHKMCYEWDRKIRPETFSNVLSNRSAKEKFEERYQAFRFFLDNGNPKRKDCLYYIMAKRLFNQGGAAKYEGYYDAIRDMAPYLKNNKYLKEDTEYSKLLSPYIN